MFERRWATPEEVSEYEDRYLSWFVNHRARVEADLEQRPLSDWQPSMFGWRGPRRPRTTSTGGR